MRVCRWAVTSPPRTLQAIAHIHSTSCHIPDNLLSTLYLVFHLVITTSLPDPSDINRYMTHEVVLCFSIFIQRCRT